MTTDTPAAELRAAAELLREAASHATPGPWRTHDTHLGGTGGHTATVLTDRPNINDTDLVAWLPTMSHEPWDEARNAWRNAGWMALIDPSVGLALADWLEQAAKAHDATIIGAASVWRRPEEAAERDAWVAKQTDHAALVVARRILGTTEQADTETAPWAGATELVPDREIRALAVTGLVGYRQDNGRLLHCLAHKPVPASRWADFHEVTADDLDDGGMCVHPCCGRDLLAAWPAPSRLAAEAQQPTPAVAEETKPEGAPDTDTALARAIPDWEAVYEPGNVSDYLIGYANSEAAAKGAAIAWVLSQSDKTADRLEWAPQNWSGEHDEWFDLIERHDDGIDTGVGVTVRHRVRPYTAADFSSDERE